MTVFAHPPNTELLGTYTEFRLWHAAAWPLWNREVSLYLCGSKQHSVLASPVDERNATTLLAMETLKESLRNICWSTEKAMRWGRTQPMGKSEVRADTQEGWNSSWVAHGVQTGQCMTVIISSICLSWLCFVTALERQGICIFWGLGKDNSKQNREEVIKWCA